MPSSAIAKPKVPPNSPAPPPPVVEKPTRLKLGLVPNAAAAGAVVVTTKWGDFVTFPALAADEIGIFGPVGTAVIELTGCRARTFSYSTDDEQHEPPFYGELASGAIYEIKNSSWTKKVDAEATQLAQLLVGGSKTKQKPKQLKQKPVKHYVFTFNATTFQCIAEGLLIDVRSDPFGMIAADLARQGLGD